MGYTTYPLTFYLVIAFLYLEMRRAKDLDSCDNDFLECLRTNQNIPTVLAQPIGSNFTNSLEFVPRSLQEFSGARMEILLVF